MIEPPPFQATPPRRLCRGCGLVPPIPRFELCEGCRAVRCAQCAAPGGLHLRTCPERPPKWCAAGCGAVAPARFQYCRDCRERLSGRRCRACDAPIFSEAAGFAEHAALAVAVAPETDRHDLERVRDGRGLRYCVACRAQRCGTCQRRGGLHQSNCPRDAGRGRVAAPYRGVVTEQAFVALYASIYRRAVRAARRRGAWSEAEDAVQETALYLWKRRDTLVSITARLFLMATEQRAGHLRDSAWRRHHAPEEASLRAR